LLKIESPWTNHKNNPDTSIMTSTNANIFTEDCAIRAFAKLLAINLMPRTIPQLHKDFFQVINEAGGSDLTGLLVDAQIDTSTVVGFLNKNKMWVKFMSIRTDLGTVSAMTLGDLNGKQLKGLLLLRSANAAGHFTASHEEMINIRPEILLWDACHGDIDRYEKMSPREIVSLPKETYLMTFPKDTLPHDGYGMAMAYYDETDTMQQDRDRRRKILKMCRDSSNPFAGTTGIYDASKTSAVSWADINDQPLKVVKVAFDPFAKIELPKPVSKPVQQSFNPMTKPVQPSFNPMMKPVPKQVQQSFNPVSNPVPKPVQQSFNPVSNPVPKPVPTFNLAAKPFTPAKPTTVPAVFNPVKKPVDMSYLLDMFKN